MWAIQYSEHWNDWLLELQLAFTTCLFQQVDQGPVAACQVEMKQDFALSDWHTWYDKQLHARAMIHAQVYAWMIGVAYIIEW